MLYTPTHPFFLSSSHSPAIYWSIHHPLMQALTQPNSGPATSPNAGGKGMNKASSCPHGAQRVNSKGCVWLIFHNYTLFESGRALALLLLSLLRSTVPLPKGILGNKVCPKGQLLLALLIKGTKTVFPKRNGMWTTCIIFNFLEKILTQRKKKSGEVTFNTYSFNPRYPNTIILTQDQYKKIAFFGTCHLWNPVLCILQSEYTSIWPHFKRSVAA